MPNYRRLRHPGGTYFFTVNLLRRQGNGLLVNRIDDLRKAMRETRKNHPFVIHAWCVLPEHLHCVLEMPEGDCDYANRWFLIKQSFSKAIPKTEWRSVFRLRRGERGIWQRRFWEHLIRDDDDYRAHVDYVHINPVKHGLVSQVRDWPFSTFHRCAREGIYPNDWAGSELADQVEVDAAWD